jgi:hypothetical protein
MIVFQRIPYWLYREPRQAKSSSIPLAQPVDRDAAWH